MPPKTISEKILSLKSNQDARQGQVVVCDVDGIIGTDASTPMALDYFDAMGGKSVAHPENVVFAMDHYAPAPNEKATQLHQRMRDFAALHNIHVWDIGQGIGHQLIVESGKVAPGSLIVGADSHTVTCGALNAFATGIGSSDFAAVLISGKIWLRVPASIKVTLTGELQPGVFPKDIALALALELGADGAIYQAIEFDGPALPSLALEDRLVLSNFVVEMGAKNGVFPADERTFEYLGHTCPAVAPDPGAEYVREIVIPLDRLEPQIAMPATVDNVVEVGKIAGTPVGMVYLGTCTGGRTRDFHQALEVLRAGGGPAPGVQLVITPASTKVMQELASDGSLGEFLRMGAVLVTPGCGSCCGTCGAIPGDNINVISTANRNFKGRMGNSKAAIYLASPASCAAAAVSGRIADPREFKTADKTTQDDAIAEELA
jgi:3-isopropylmalate/(R)-2-methylmalate dehydratase large subunit